MTLRVHHIAIIASDYARARHFYVDVLRLAVLNEVFREDRLSWKCDLDAGNVQIELFSFPHPPPRQTRPEACGLRHLAFAVEDLDRELMRLLDAGIASEPVRTDPYTGRRFTFVADPDDLPIELYETVPALTPR